jgi:hypothetical protein
LLLLRAKSSSAGVETRYVRLHEVWEIREVPSSLDEAARSRKSLDYLYGDLYSYGLKEDGRGSGVPLGSVHRELVPG